MLIITILVFVFALVSGSEGYEEGFVGIIKNSPNTFPWIFLFGINYLVWRKELLGGIILTIFGLFITWFFNIGDRFYLEVFIMTSLITLLGISFIYFGIKKNE